MTDVRVTESGDRREAPREDEARRAHHDAIFAFARAAERHDPATGDHLVRIRRVVECIAVRMGVPDAEALAYDAMLHDVGKLTVPPEILRKPAPLDDAERRVMESHTIEGERILGDRGSMQRAARIARSHHERWDGSGYPDGLAGTSIPPEAAITSAADILDALLSERSYKEAWSYAEAIARIRELSGTALAPVVVEAIGRCHDAGELETIFLPPSDA